MCSARPHIVPNKTKSNVRSGLCLLLNLNECACVLFSHSEQVTSPTSSENRAIQRKSSSDLRSSRFELSSETELSVVRTVKIKTIDRSADQLWPQNLSHPVLGADDSSAVWSPELIARNDTNEALSLKLRVKCKCERNNNEKSGEISSLFLEFSRSANVRRSSEQMNE